MYQFTNDYSYLAHPRIIKALEKCSNEHNIAYGLDKHSFSASNYIKDIFDVPNASIHYLAGGTQTNMVLISSAIKHYEGVIAANSGHINVHETAAIEGSGHKIITVNGKDGKVYPNDIKEVMELNNNEHMVKPALVFISNSTEIGTIYTRKELLDLREVCDEYGLYLYLDGARLGSALTSKECDYEPSFLGHVLDAFYIGGTKNGFLFGEALVIVNKQLQKDFRYAIKNKGAMLAKGYAVGIQFEEAFKDGLYFDIAKATNEVADYLKDKLAISSKEQPTNQIFIKLDNKKAQEVINKFGTEMWNKGKNESEIRIVISFMTAKKDVDELIEFLK